LIYVELRVRIPTIAVIGEWRSDLEGLAFPERFSREAASALLTKAKGMDEEVRLRYYLWGKARACS
jgi:hypothetical protein